MLSCTRSLPTSSALVFLSSSPHPLPSSLLASPPVRNYMLGEIQLAVHDITDIFKGAPPLPTHFLGVVARDCISKTITDTRKKPTTV